MAAIKEQHKLFVKEYLVDYHGENAAIRAGFTAKSARSQASKMLSMPKIQKELKAQQSKLTKKLEISATRVLEELGRVAFSDIRTLFDDDGNLLKITDLDKDTTATLAGLDITTTHGAKNEDGTDTVEQTYKFKQWDKIAALEKLARHLGMFKEDGTSLNINVNIEGRDADCG